MTPKKISKSAEQIKSAMLDLESPIGNAALVAGIAMTLLEGLAKSKCDKDGFIGLMTTKEEFERLDFAIRETYTRLSEIKIAWYEGVGVPL